jgi:hypothetical protein
MTGADEIIAERGLAAAGIFRRRARAAPPFCRAARRDQGSAWAPDVDDAGHAAFTSKITWSRLRAEGLTTLALAALSLVTGVSVRVAECGEDAVAQELVDRTGVILDDRN